MNRDEAMERYVRERRVFCPKCQKYGTEGSNCLSGTGGLVSGPECLDCGTHVLYVDVCDRCGAEALKEYDYIGALCEEHEDVYKNFWDDYLAAHQNLPHVCDTSLADLERRHKNVIWLIAEHPEWASGLAVLLAGEYYKDVFCSRSCSEHVACLFGLDYLDVYCAGGSYLQMLIDGRDSDMVRAFDEARKKDDEGRE